MLQKVLTKYWLVISIGATALLTWFVPPGSITALSLISLLWLSLLSAELFILIPAVNRGENFAAARARALKSLVGDPFLYVGVLMAAYLFVQWFNGGCVPEYDANAGVWNYSTPAVSWLPFSIDRVDALRMFNIMTACIVSGLCLRHAIGKNSKRYLLQWLSCVSGALAVFALWKGLTGVAPYAGLLTQPEAGMLGTLFGFWMVIGIGSYAEASTLRQHRTEMIYLLAIGANFAGMLYFAALPALMLYTAVGFLVLIYFGVYTSAHVSKSFLTKFYLLTFIIITSILVLSLLVLPQSSLTAKVGLTADLSGYWETLLATKKIRSEAALQIWKESMWFGKGAEGYQHYLGTVLDDQGWSLVRVNKGLVYNDLIQALCEFGVLGSAILSALILTLLIPVCHRAHIAWGHDTHDINAGRKYLLRISPLVVTGVIATLCCFGESFIASPYRLPAIFVSVFIVMLTMPAFLPSK